MVSIARVSFEFDKDMECGRVHAHVGQLLGESEVVGTHVVLSHYLDLLCKQQIGIGRLLISAEKGTYMLKNPA